MFRQKSYGSFHIKRSRMPLITYYFVTNHGHIPNLSNFLQGIYVCTYNYMLLLMTVFFAIYDIKTSKIKQNVKNITETSYQKHND